MENENGGFREKVSDFSQDLRQIRSLVGLRDKKKKRSTRSRLRVDSEFVSF